MDLFEFLFSERGLDALRAAIIVLVGFAVAKLGSIATRRVSEKYLEPQQTALLRRIVFYGIVVLSFTPPPPGCCRDPFCRDWLCLTDISVQFDQRPVSDRGKTLQDWGFHSGGGDPG